MSCSTVLIACDPVAAYDLGEGHPMRPIRATLTAELARELGVLSTHT